MGGAHLYGRRLVVEYASDETSVDELRTKTAAKFRNGGEGEDEMLLGAPAAKRMKKGL